MTAAVNYMEVIPRAEDEWIHSEATTFSKGHIAWSEVWAGIGSDTNDLSSDKTVELEKRAVYALQHLDANGLVSFCQYLRRYRQEHATSDLFSKFPCFESARERYPTELESLDKKCDLLDKYKTPAILLTGVLAFVGGAMGVGNLADSGIDNTSLNHIVTAAGSLVSGILGGGVAGVGYLLTDSWLDNQKRKIGEKTKEDLVAKVRSYLAVSY